MLIVYLSFWLCFIILFECGYLHLILSVPGQICASEPKLVENIEDRFSHVGSQMSVGMRKPDFCICENKDADQLRAKREADQRLCFRYCTIPLLPKYEISSLLPSSMAVQSGLCRTWSETPKNGFITTRLIYCVLSGNSEVQHLLFLHKLQFNAIQIHLQRSFNGLSRTGIDLCISISLLFLILRGF